MNIFLPILFVIAIALNFAYLKLARFLSIVDASKSRSAHKGKVVSSGGVVFASGFIIILFYYFFSSDLVIQGSFFWTLVCSGGLFATIGFIDDWFELRPKTRLFCQIFACLISAIIITPTDWYLYQVWSINYPFTLFFVFVYFLSFTNVFNFMDGINGLSAIQTIFVLIPLSLLGNEFSEIYLFLGVFIFAFLLFNFPKAKMFMGDSGSYFLGIILPISICHHTFLTDTNIFFALNTLFLIFWADVFVTLLFRIANKENILLAHNQHFYQKLTRMTGSHTKTIFIFTVFSITVLAPLSYLCYYSQPAISASIFLITTLFMITLFLFLQLKYAKK